MNKLEACLYLFIPHTYKPQESDVKPLSTPVVTTRLSCILNRCWEDGEDFEQNSSSF